MFKIFCIEFNAWVIGAWVAKLDLWLWAFSERLVGAEPWPDKIVLGHAGGVVVLSSAHVSAGYNRVVGLGPRRDAGSDPLTVKSGDGFGLGLG